ncbi:MAG: TerB family tellurite resistance protein [Rhodobacterales bacterium]|nr:TerB family tellurite resistance protein [Rhodobacterales bacterium]
MIDILRRLLAPDTDRLPEPDARLAMAALLVRIARTDGLYSAEEVERIDRVLAQRHGLGPFEAARLRTDAEVLEQEAPDTVRFTRAIKLVVPLQDRSLLMTALWSVALADGLRDAEEDRLMRLVANLLGLTDVESAQARQQAERESDLP